ncbi:MAG: hypothetical protein AB8H03_20050 [Saprospiraceae bacterium]
MREAIILEDGYIVYLDEISETETFDAEDTDVLFSIKTGRVRRFKGNQGLTNNDYFKALYSVATGKFNGYFPEVEFWEKETPKKNNNEISGISERDFRYFNLVDWGPNIINNLQTIEQDTKVLSIIKEMDWQSDNDGNLTNVELKIKIKKFNFKNLASQYPTPENFKVNGNRVLYNGKALSFDDIDASFDGFDEVEIISPLDSNFLDYSISTQVKEFINPDGTTSFNYYYDVTLITDIVHLFQQLLFDDNELLTYLNTNNLYIPFQRHFDLVRASFFATDPIITEQEYYSTFTREYFSLMRLRLIEFKEWVDAIAFKPNFLFTNILSLPKKIDFVVRIVSLFSHLELSKLSYLTKTQLLEDMIKNNYWLKGNWNPFFSGLNLTEEEVVVKIVQSISSEDDNGNLNHNEINDFLDMLSKPPSFISDTKKSYYQILYDKIDDNTFFGDDGKGNKGQFVKSIYLLWLNSKYNPNNTDLPSATLVSHSYTPHNASWQFEDETFVGPATFDETASPELINYESEKVLLWYDDNFNFPFKGDKIVAMHEEYKDFDEFLLDSFWSLVIPFKPNSTTKYVPFGFYDIFTPISIARTGNLETIIGIPVAENVDTPCALSAEDENKNQIPIFYLKYVDDLGDYSDFKEAVGVVVDVALTFVGGIGIYKNLASGGGRVLRRFLAGEVLEAAAVNTLRKIAFQSWELILGAASLAYSISTGGCTIYSNSPCAPPAQGTPEYDEFKRCQEINKWLLILEVVTLSGDLLAKRLFKKSTRQLNQNIPDNLPNTPENQDLIALKNKLNQIDNVADDLVEFLADLDPAIANKLDDLGLDVDGKIAFMDDFLGSSNSTLSKLAQNDAVAVERWKALRDLDVIDRKNINILTNDSLYDGFILFCSKSNINDFLRSLNSADRIKFIQKYNRSPFNFTAQILDKINNSPSRRNLMVSHMNNPRTTHVDKFKDADIKRILESDLIDIHVDLLDVKMSMALRKANDRYLRNITNTIMDQTIFTSIFNGTIGNFNLLSIASKRRLKKLNKYITETKVYDADGNLINTIEESFVSASNTKFNYYFDGPTPNWITNPPDQDLFDIFTLKALDRTHPNSIARNNDTELKFIFNFLEQHWSTGSKFSIKASSTLYTCTSCQGYLVYLQKLAEKYNKSIVFEVISDPRAITMGDAKKLIN